MTKKIRLTITGIQTGFGQEDVSEVITTADYYDNGGRKYLFYTEYTEDRRQIRSRLTIAPDYIELKKTGDNTSVLTFREGIIKPCIYQTPVGPMELLSDTRRIDIREEEDILIIYMEYSLIMNGERMSDYKLTVKAQSMMNA